MNNEYEDNLIIYLLLCFGCYSLSLPSIYTSAQELMLIWQWMDSKMFAEVICLMMGMAIACFLHRLIFGMRD